VRAPAPADLNRGGALPCRVERSTPSRAAGSIQRGTLQADGFVAARIRRANENGPMPGSDRAVR